MGDTSKPFAVYRGGLAPAPGQFYTAESVDRRKTPLTVGDTVRDLRPGRQHIAGIVIAVGGPWLFYLIDASGGTKANTIDRAFCHEVVVHGHADDFLAVIEHIDVSVKGGPR